MVLMETDGMMIDEIREELFRQQDTKYRDFQSRLIPAVRSETVIGVRTPALRELAKRISRREDADVFLRALPHAYFDENQLHAFIISEIRDFAACLDAVERFLPYVDNWATCDQMSPRIFAKHRQELIAPIRRWIGSGAVYSVRFGVKMLMSHYLDDAFDPAWPELVAAIRSEEYYVRMMVAWYFATALAKRFDDALPYIEERRLDAWTNNMTIRKAIESDRISPAQKDFLRGLRVREA